METIVKIMLFSFLGLTLVMAISKAELRPQPVCIDHYAVIETVYYQPAAFWVDEEWHYVARKENGETYGISSRSAKQEGDSVRYKTTCTDE